MNAPGRELPQEPSAAPERARGVALPGSAIGEVAARASAAGFDIATAYGNPNLVPAASPAGGFGRNLSAMRLILGLPAEAEEADAALVNQRVPYRFGPGSLTVLDQRVFPGRVSEVALADAPAVAAAIRDGVLQGAGTVAAVGGYGLVLGARSRAHREAETTAAEQLAAVESDGWQIAAAAPWVTPLGRSIEGLLAVARNWAAESAAGGAEEGATGLAEALSRAADEAILNDLLGLTRLVPAGVELLRAECASLGRDRRLRVLVHGPVGSLSFGLLGTAVAALQGAISVGLPIHVWVAQGQPPFTGARTAWELATAGIANGLVPDSGIGGMMAAHDIDLVLLGALGVLRDGALIDEPGAYGTAALAARHSVPVYVFAPSSTFFEASDSRLTASYDLTPPEVISGFITEMGIVRPPFAPQLALLGRLADAGRAPALDRP